MKRMIVAVTLLAAAALPAAARSPRPVRPGPVLRIAPADQALMSLRQLEMAPFLSARSRMALTQARFDLQSFAWRAERGFGGAFELDRVMARLYLVARDPQLSPFDRLRLAETARALRLLRFGVR